MSVGQTINVGRIMADLEVDSGQMLRGLGDGRRGCIALEKELRQLDSELRANAITMTAHAARTAAATNALNQIRAAMQGAYSSARISAGGLDVFNRQAAKLTSTNWGRFALGLNQAGNIVDDFQYSVQACVNNIGPLVHGLTGNMGLAGAMQIAAVAANYLYNHWYQLVYQLTGDDSHFKDACNSIEGLTEYVKMLKAELETAPAIGDAFKLSQLEGQEHEWRADVKEAKSHDEDRSDKEKKDSQRFGDAISDAKAHRRGEMNDLDAIAAKAEYDKAKNGDAAAKHRFVQQFASQADKDYYAQMEHIADPRSSLKKGFRLNPYMGSEVMVALRGKDAAKDRMDQVMERAQRGAKEYYERQRGNAGRNADARGLYLNRMQALKVLTPDEVSTAKGLRLTRNEQDAKDKAEGKQEARVGGLAAAQAKKDAAQAKKDAKAKADATKKRIAISLRDASESHRLKKQEEAEKARAKSEAERTRREKLKEAKEAVPGGVDILETAYGLSGGGMATLRAREAIAAKLESRGMTRKQAFDAASDMQSEARKHFEEDITERALKPGRQSEVMSAADIGKRVQSAVSGENKQVDLLEAIKEHLAEIKAAELNRQVFRPRQR